MREDLSVWKVAKRVIIPGILWVEWRIGGEWCELSSDFGGYLNINPEVDQNREQMTNELEVLFMPIIGTLTPQSDRRSAHPMNSAGYFYIPAILYGQGSCNDDTFHTGPGANKPD